jgi:hypothetical protein
LLDRLSEFCDGRVESIQQLQPISSSPARPGSQPEGLQLLPSAFPPQPLLAAQPFLESYGLQLIHDPRAGLHHAMPVPEKLPQIAILPARHPDLRKTILEKQTQDQLRILAIRFLLPYALGSDLGRVSDPQLQLQLSQQSFEPAWVPAGFHSNPYLLARSRQTPIELLRLLAMRESLFLKLSGLGIHRSHLLKLGVEIYSFGSFLPSLLVGFSTTNFTRAWEPTLSRNQLHSLTP